MLRTIGVLHEWGYSMLPGDNCMFDLTDQDINQIMEAWGLLHDSDNESEGSYNLREGDLKMFHEMEK